MPEGTDTERIRIALEVREEVEMDFTLECEMEPEDHLRALKEELAKINEEVNRIDDALEKLWGLTTDISIEKAVEMDRYLERIWDAVIDLRKIVSDATWDME